MTKAQILSDNSNVWVNGRGGVCLGRFGRNGIDIHKDAAGQIVSGDECLDCTHERTTLADWHRFKEGMLKFHGVRVAEKYRPARLKV